ncbi:MAG TPA: cellulase family glycosylhydrolase [Chitinophagaceae bacterium]|nr:cellulase family glycosylhydrolase [Chitinophagaceae bacterium]
MKIKFILVFFLAYSLSSSAQSKFISVKGKEVIGTDGKPFLIRGTNLGNWLVPEGYMFKFGDISSPRLIDEVITELLGPADAKAFWQKYLNTYITEDDIHYLKSIGVNSIRIPFNYRIFSDETYLGSHGDKRGFMLMDRVIGWCKKEGLYVILDMHCAPGGQTGDNIDDGYGYPFLFESEESQKQTAAIWKKIAAHYKNETTVLGYDMLNEPIATYFDKDKFNPHLEPVFKSITAAIRSVDTNHIVILGGAQWDSNFKIFGQPFDSKAMYTFHKYWTPPTKSVIQDYLDFRDKYNVPIYCGETGENTDGWVDSFRVMLEQNNVGWHFWPYKKIDNTRGFVTFPVPQFYDEVMAYADSPRTTFADIRKARPKNMDEIKKALDGFLQNCRFKNCTVNKGYVTALGFKTE